jgi:hypothetical protein
MQLKVTGRSQHQHGQTYFGGRESQLIDLLMLHDNIIADGGEPVGNVRRWLRDRGYFIPSSKDIKQLRSLNDLKARVHFLDELNRRKNAIDRAQMLCVPAQWPTNKPS